jgi:preprotein translocase subunit SecG
MEAVLLVIHLIVALGIIVMVLIQPSEAGGFLGSGGSMSNMMMKRRSGDVLTRATTILAGVFFLTSLLLAVMAGSRPVQKSILDVDTGAPPAATATAPAKEEQKKPEEAKKSAPAKKETPKAPVSK